MEYDKSKIPEIIDIAISRMDEKQKLDELKHYMRLALLTSRVFYFNTIQRFKITEDEIHE